MGRSWVKGLKPLKNVGANIAGEIESIIYRLEKQSSAPVGSFQTNVSNIRKKKKRSPPNGNETPRTIETSTRQYIRDAEIVAWVLDIANGICECCGNNAPFEREDGTAYLEIHHLKRLADGGSDKITNTIAVCPDCHRELHYGENKEQRKLAMYDSVGRLFPE